MMTEGDLPLPISDFRKRWRRVLIAAQINKEGGSREENFHFHDLRTVFAGRMREKGADAFTIQKAFGHSSMSITDIYMEEDLERIRAAVKRLDDVQDMEGVQ
jgi:integrase